MKKGILTLLLLATIANAIDLQWSFDRSNHVFTFSYQAQSNHVYEIVRQDVATNYFDIVHFNECRTNGVVTCVIAPKMCGGEDYNQHPGDNLQFYLVDATYDRRKAK